MYKLTNPALLEKMTENQKKTRERVYGDKHITEILSLKEAGSSLRSISDQMLKEFDLKLSHSSVGKIIKEHKDKFEENKKILSDTILAIKSYEDTIQVLKRKQSNNQISSNEKQKLEKLLEESEKMGHMKVITLIISAWEQNNRTL